MIATPCDASGRFLVGEDGVIPTQLIQYDLQTQQKTDFCYQPALNGARDIALSSASLAREIAELQLGEEEVKHELECV